MNQKRGGNNSAKWCPTYLHLQIIYTYLQIFACHLHICKSFANIYMSFAYLHVICIYLQFFAHICSHLHIFAVICTYLQVICILTYHFCWTLKCNKQIIMLLQNIVYCYMPFSFERFHVKVNQCDIRGKV